MKIPILAIYIIAIFCGSCVKEAFYPVNVGREHGNAKTPLFLSHLPKGNQSILNRTEPHFFLRKIVCFDYACRKMMGQRRALNAISFEAFQKQIRKNAKKGRYKKATPSVKHLKSDTITILNEPEQISSNEQILPVVLPILKADSLIILNELLFETNSHKLKTEHYAALDSIAKFLLAHPTLEVNVSGHTDSIGKEHNNLALSTRRAEAVAEYLIDKGVLFANVTYEGFGSSKSIMSNETIEGRSKNRRVEILIQNPTKK